MLSHKQMFKEHKIMLFCPKCGETTTHVPVTDGKRHVRTDKVACENCAKQQDIQKPKRHPPGQYKKIHKNARPLHYMNMPYHNQVFWFFWIVSWIGFVVALAVKGWISVVPQALALFLAFFCDWRVRKWETTRK
jgi:hypothetical protein